MTKQNDVEAFWQSYLAVLPQGSEPRLYEVFSFGDNEATANELARLVMAGIKTATCSLVWAYVAEQKDLPGIGDHSIVTDWNGEPLCVIETTEAEIRAFNEVGDAHASGEGEGDRTLAYWRRVHWDCFSRECAAIGREPDETMPLLCERFQVVHRKEIRA